MSLSVQCDACRSTFKVKTEYAGRRMKCPKCESPISIPQHDEVLDIADVIEDDVDDYEDYDSENETYEDYDAPQKKPVKQNGPKRNAPNSATKTQRPVQQALSREEQVRLLNQLDEGIEPVQTTIMYRLSIGLVASLMVLLPLIYIALIGLVGYGVYWHLLNDVGMLQVKARGKAMVLVLLAYAAPAIAGIVLIGFMLKPLFARKRSGSFEPQTIRRKDEPFLFEFVDQLCDAVGSPRPKSILLDDRVNAAAAMTSSVWNPFRRDLMLVIGLPLVASLQLKDFAGILAHEFGHFSQGAGMRLGRIIDQVNHWFAFVVYQRDAWDEKLEQWSQEADLQVGWIIYLTRGCVWMTRKILHGLMLLGHAMSCRLSREMEFDADRHLARLSGSDTVSVISQQLPVLIGAQNWAYNDLSRSYKEGRLVDNFFQLISHRAQEIPDDAKKQLIKESLSQKTGWFDTHPCDADRIDSADIEDTDGILDTDLPASVLFKNFAETCRAETRKLYEYKLGDEVSRLNLVALEDILARQKAEKDEDEVIDRVLYGMCHYYWTLPFPESLQPITVSPKDALRRIEELRSGLPSLSKPHLKQIRKLTQNHLLRQESNLAERLLWIGMKIGEQSFSVPMTKLDQVASVRNTVEVEMNEAHDGLAPILGHLAERLTLPIRMLMLPQVVSRIENGGQLIEQANHLIESANSLQAHRESFFLCLNHRELIRDIFKQLDGREKHEGLIGALMRASRDGIKLLKESAEPLRTIPYPFDHAQKGISVGDFLLPDLPPAEDPSAVDASLSHFANEGFTIAWRTIARLSLIVEQVETALGLPKGEVPKEGSKEDSDGIDEDSNAP